MDKTYKISIVEDQNILRENLIQVLEKIPEFTIFSSYSSVEEAEADAIIQASDIVLLDISLPGKDGIELIDFLIKRNPSILIIMLTIHYDNEYIFNAISKGAVGFLVKNTTGQDISKAIFEAIDGGSPMTPRVARKVLTVFQEKNINKSTSKLTDRETEILNYLTDGLSYKEIANKVMVSQHTVNYHLRNIYSKLQVKTRAEAVAKTQNFKLF